MKKEKALIVPGLIAIVLLLGCVANEKHSLPPTTISATSTTIAPVASTTLPDNRLEFNEPLLLAKTDVEKALQSCPQTEELNLFCSLKVFCEASANPDNREKTCEVYGIKPGDCDFYLNSCTDPKTSFEKCADMYSGEEIDLCKSFILNVATANGIASQSRELCSGIGLESLRYECLITIAIQNRDLEMCADIGAEPWVGRCYWEIALTYEEPDICNYIKDQTDRGKCFKQAQNR